MNFEKISVILKKEGCEKDMQILSQDENLTSYVCFVQDALSVKNGSIDNKLLQKCGGYFYERLHIAKCLDKIKKLLRRF